MSLINMKMAFSGGSIILFLITYTNCPTVRSAGTRYLRLSISGISDFSALSQITGIRFWNFSAMRSDSALRFSNGYSDLKEDFMNGSNIYPM